jgi:signal transduction histidine kinase
MKQKSILDFIFNPLRGFSLRTRLLLILLFLLGTSLASLTIIYNRSEEMLIDQVMDDIDHITNAIQISVEELTLRGNATQRLKSYVDMLNKKGIKEISIIGGDSQVIASSDPRKIGTRQKISTKESGKAKQKGKLTKKKDLFITATIGEKSERESQRLHHVIMPVSIKGQNIGYILVSMVLDDYRALQKRNHLKRIFATVFAFALGMIVSLLLAERYTEPIKKIAQASRKIAQGNLVKIRDTGRRDEIGVLVKSFNEMVAKLEEKQGLEEKLQKSEKLSMVGQLASGIAHEVRNPLNFLSLSIGHIKERIAEEKLDDGAQVISLLDDLSREIHRVNELINNFLFLGKPLALDKESVSPDSLMDEVLYLLKDKTREGIRIRVECPENCRPLYCDRAYMRMCLSNLLLNSVQAVEGDGQIVVEFGGSDQFSSISVRDNGKGIEKQNLEKIFEPYYSTKKMGIGLGLTITKRLVEEHGGTISIESEAGKGTVTRIEVPGCEE